MEHEHTCPQRPCDIGEKFTDVLKLCLQGEIAIQHPIPVSQFRRL